MKTLKKLFYCLLMIGLLLAIGSTAFAQTAEKRSLTLDGAERVIAAAKAEAAKVKAPGGVIAVESVAPSISQSGANGWSRMESADSHQEPSAAI